ncbi:MAG: STAS domain-containing protein [Thermoguttaceae bacterium]|jgi:anti-anti-sigma factor
MELNVLSDDGPILHVGVQGAVSMAALAEQSELLAELLKDRGYKTAVLLNLANAEQIDSAGMSWLVVQHKRFCDAGGQFVIHSVPYTVMETFKVMRLDRVLNLAANQAEAMKLVQGAAG